MAEVTSKPSIVPASDAEATIAVVPLPGVSGTAPEGSQAQPPTGELQGSPSSGTPPAASVVSVAAVDSAIAPESAHLSAGTTAGIRKDAYDNRGQKIEYVFFRRTNYVIYLADNRVSIQFSDSPAEATAQIKAIAELLPLRNKLQYLARGLPKNDERVDDSWCYLTQVADAMRLGLEGQIGMGRDILQGAIEDVTSLVERDGRVCYLKAAATGMAAWAIVSALGAAGTSWLGYDFIAKMFAASCSGAIGAILSIAIGIRNRTVAIDGDRRGNSMEAQVRILIGVISGVALYLILSSGLVSGIDWMLTADKPGAWKITLLIGFAGGFLERLVPDLLEKSATRLTSKTTPAAKQ
jgi:hypothetical protein